MPKVRSATVSMEAFTSVMSPVVPCSVLTSSRQQ
jgi:hypothetical protein